MYLLLKIECASKSYGIRFTLGRDEGETPTVDKSHT